jgi:hypothetical protein
MYLKPLCSVSNNLSFCVPRQVNDAGPKVVRLDHVVHLAVHLFLELGHIGGVLLVPQRQRWLPLAACS